MKPLFPGQQETERIYLMTRQHWLTLVPKLLLWLFFAALPIVFEVFVVRSQPMLQQGTGSDIFNLFKSIYFMGLAVSLFAVWILYYLNYQIITNERVVDMTQKNLLYHTISEVNLTKIQDVTAEIHGFLGTFFDFGNVYLQTAAEKERFVFDNVPNPHRIAKLILDLYEKLPKENHA
ncbi:MAG: hypothetical protein Q8R08_02220 [bacterium]|nr:hypothetical protein [bacterium]